MEFRPSVSNAKPAADRRGFSTVLAILITALLVILTAGALFLFLAESRTNQSLFNGFSSYAAAEAGMEYALLKVKNHREGFEDALAFGTPESLVSSGTAFRAVSAAYDLSAYARNYSGTIAPGGIEIIPLFFDKGRILNTNPTPALPFKNPNPGSSDIERTSDFLITADGGFAWNIVGSDTSGATFGIVGTGGTEGGVGNDATATVTSGMVRKDGVEEISAESSTIANFLSDYSDAYLFLTNPGDLPMNYSIKSSNGFSLPGFRVSASGKTGDSVSHLEFSENRSSHFDALKYSLFNGGN